MFSFCLCFQQIKHCQQELHISGEKSSMLFIYLAIASFFSRHIFCTLGDFRCFNRFHLYQVAMTISGLCVICLPLAKSFPSIAAIFIVFGLMEGAQMGQLTLLVLECVGNDKMNQAWGYLMPSLGLSFGIGPPLAGELKTWNLIGHFRVSKTLTFKMRLGAQPFL